MKSSILVRLIVCTLSAAALFGVGTELRANDLKPARREPGGLTFSQSTTELAAYDFIEFSVEITTPTADNPFTDVSVAGEFRNTAERRGYRVDGFCDSRDGRLFRVRFMPSSPGVYSYTVRYRQGAFERRHVGTFSVRDGQRPGPIRASRSYPWHFVWEGSREYFFLNSVSALFLMGWDDVTIREILDRFHSYKVNRVRVLLSGRSQPRPWGTPVVSTDSFRLALNPWVAERPGDVDDPGFDLERFNLPYWRKFERLLHVAREKDMIVSVVFFLGNKASIPFIGMSAAERRYLHHAVARFAAFSNVTWDLGHEHNFVRPYPNWADTMGYVIKGWDPYDHLLGAHNQAYRTVESDWIDVQLLQRWDDGQNAYLIEERKKQERTGRILPLVNEQYGFEDLWEGYDGQRSADSRRQIAWHIYMAGCYQGTGESTRQGTGVPPDTGGGWINGRGDQTMTLLSGYAHIVDFFTSFQWWKGTPRNDLVTGSALCLADPGNFYALYLPRGGTVSVQIGGEGYRALWFHPRSGEWIGLPRAEGPTWSTPVAPDEGDWAALVIRESLMADVTAPDVRYVSVAEDGTKIFVGFDEPITRESAENTRNYRVQPDHPNLHAEFDVTTGAGVTITGLALDEEKVYSLELSGIVDRAHPGNVLEKPLRRRFRYVHVPRPAIHFSFNEGVGRETGNSGTSWRRHPRANLTERLPKWSGNVPTALAGAFSLDFGPTEGDDAVDLQEGVPVALREAVSFSITGWLNQRFRSGGEAGSCVLTTRGVNDESFDLTISRRGELRFGINTSESGGLVASSPGSIPEDPRVRKDNWRFFAVTYDATKGMNQVSFYFGTAQEPVTRDRQTTLVRDKVVPASDGALTLGHVVPRLRTRSAQARGFRGLMDEMRVYTSRVDGSGALTLSQILTVQKLTTVPAAESPHEAEAQESAGPDGQTDTAE